MNATKLAFATVTALSVMGAATFANAQTPAPAASSPQPGMQQPMGPSGSTGSMDSTQPNRANTGTMNGTAQTPMSDNTANTPTRQRVARADRN